MHYEVMPQAAKQAGMTDTAWIEEASRKNFLRYIASASEEFKPEERGEIAPLFDAWAARVGAQDAVKKFAEGGTVRMPFDLKEAGRNLVRPFAKRLIASLRG